MSDIYDTRQGEDSVVRKRKCFKGHAFITTETAGEPIPAPAKREGSLLSVQIRAALNRGEDPEAIAQKLGASVSYVYQIGRQIIRQKEIES